MPINHIGDWYKAAHMACDMMLAKDDAEARRLKAKLEEFLGEPIDYEIDSPPLVPDCEIESTVSLRPAGLVREDKDY